MTHRFSESIATNYRFDAGSTPVDRQPQRGGEALDLRSDRDAPRSAVFIPEGYEQNYAYPLVVWFHDSGESEQVLHRIMPEVSDRNALGIAIRGEQAVGLNRFDWSEKKSEERESKLVSAIRSFRRDHHIHSERIVLAGRGIGARIAAEQFFSRPDWFGGLALFDVPSEALSLDLSQRAEFIGKPVLLDLPMVQLGRGREGVSRLRAAGLAVTFRHQRSKSLSRDSLRSLDRWLLGSVCGVLV